MNDITIDQNGDIDLSNGDVSYVESTQTHKADLLIASSGDYKESPLSGVGSIDYVMDSSPNGYLREVSRQMAADGMKVKKVRLEANELIIEAEYEDN